jgi:hypothetical protein
MPEVTKFTAETDLGGGKKGLHTKDGSPSDCTIEGNNLIEGSTVLVTYLSLLAIIVWTGTLKKSGHNYKSKLTTINPFFAWKEGPMCPKDTQDVTVTVTVTDTSGTSPPLTPPPVPIGP